VAAVSAGGRPNDIPKFEVEVDARFIRRVLLHRKLLAATVPVVQREVESRVGSVIVEHIWGRQHHPVGNTCLNTEPLAERRRTESWCSRGGRRA